jgi:nucleoid-associated protein YgaU
MYIISESSDRLDILASKYYGDKSYWWVISIANNLNDASFHIQPGLQLRIPSNVNAILNQVEKLNKSK